MYDSGVDWVGCSKLGFTLKHLCHPYTQPHFWKYVVGCKDVHAPCEKLASSNPLLRQAYFV